MIIIFEIFWANEAFEKTGNMGCFLRPCFRGNGAPGREKELPRYATHRVPVRTIVVVGRVDVATVEVQVVSVVLIVHSRGPVVAVAALIVQNTIAVIDVASVGSLPGSNKQTWL